MYGWLAWQLGTKRILLGALVLANLVHTSVVGRGGPGPVGGAPWGDGLARPV